MIRLSSPTSLPICRRSGSPEKSPYGRCVATPGPSTIAEIRELQAMSRDELSYRSGITTATIRRAEAGEPIRRATAEQLLGVLDHPHTRSRYWSSNPGQRQKASQRHHRLILRLERQWGLLLF